MVCFLWNISFAIVHVKFSLRDKNITEYTITEMKYNPSALIFTLVEYSTLVKQKWKYTHHCGGKEPSPPSCTPSSRSLVLLTRATVSSSYSTKKNSVKNHRSSSIITSYCTEWHGVWCMFSQYPRTITTYTGVTQRIRLETTNFSAKIDVNLRQIPSSHRFANVPSTSWWLLEKSLKDSFSRWQANRSQIRHYPHSCNIRPWEAGQSTSSFLHDNFRRLPIMSS